MTRNQLQYWANEEVKRANLAKEQETKRSNLADEMIKSWANLETRRSNLAREKEANRSNLAKERETSRSNKANEYLKWRSVRTDAKELASKERDRRISAGTQLLQAAPALIGAIGSIL